MKVTKQKDHYLFKNSNGEYHLSIDKYNELGKEKSIKFAEEEILKKTNSQYSEKTIDFKRARLLGFCKYGIEDFCKRLDLDINKEHSLLDLKNKLTKEVFISYSSECLKLFGKDVFDIFGGPKIFLQENPTKPVLSLILNSNIIDDKNLHKLACEFALMCVDNYEKEFPKDSRVKGAILVKMDWLEGNATDEELSAARSAAWSAISTRSAARSAARSAESAARSAISTGSVWSAAWSAARSASSAAESAAESVARSAISTGSVWSAAWSAALQEQIKLALKKL
jgi:hypothetical protein